MVITSTGVGEAEEGGDLGGYLGVVEEAVGGVLGGEEVRWHVGKNGGERLDGGLALREGIGP